ncbi:MAG: PAS domain-containing sensor histidine kinase [Chloroflexi bacterium]|nr:PAS domain-containing sensor histidine kinase [Chloroflexota bacterium]
MDSAANDLFRHICESAPDAIVVVDAAGRVVLVNARAVEMFGFPAGELVGSTVDILLPDALRPGHVQQRHAYMQHPSTRPMGTELQLFGRRRDGSEFPVEISLSPFQSGGATLVISILRDITERRRLEVEREQLRAVADMEKERQRIAMDLHDGIIQSIYAVGLNLESAKEDVKSRPDDAVKQVNRAIDRLNDTILDLRSYILDLRPPRYGGDLVDSLNGLVAEFHANSLIEPTLDVEPDLPALTEEQGRAIFHIAQEALNNARKHSRATQLFLRLRPVDGTLRLQIADNGSGFDPGADLPEEHRGMRNMLARAAAVGALLRVETALGAGTSVMVEIPVQTATGEPR